MQYTQSYAAVRITSGQPDLRNGACYITTWLCLFNGKFLIPHTIVVSQDYSVSFPCVSFQADISDTMTIQSKWLRLHEKDYSES